MYLKCLILLACLLSFGCSLFKPRNSLPAWADAHLSHSSSASELSKALVTLVSSEENECGIKNMLCGAKTGNGVLVSEDGLIFTLSHVLSSERPIVTLFNGKQVFGEILFQNQRTDIAIIKIHWPEKLPFLALEDATVQKGDPVFILGKRAETLELLAAKGQVYLSGINFPVGGILGEGLVLHSANIEKGLSGSPLLSASGKILAINAMYFGQEGSGKSASISIAKYRSVLEGGFLSAKHTRAFDTGTAPKIHSLADEIAWVLSGLDQAHLRSGKSMKAMQDQKASLLKEALYHQGRGLFKTRREAHAWAFKHYLQWNP